MVSDAVLYYLQETWLFVFLISIFFVFIVIFRDLGKQTRKQKFWLRRSYQKTIPRVTLSFQHYTRRGELLTVTNYTMCQNIRKDMVNYLQLKLGYSKEDLEILLVNKKQLSEIFQNDDVVEFLHNVNEWLKKNEIEKTFFQRFLDRIRSIFSEKITSDENFYIELALIIRNFRKALDN